jgi:excisionase family DNA binding protein
MSSCQPKSLLHVLGGSFILKIVMADKELLTIRDLMAYLSVGRSTIYNILKTGELPYIKLGKRVLFRKKDVDKFLESKLVK